MPALSAVLGGGRKFCEATRFPPQDERDGVDGHLGVAVLFGDARIKSEEGRDEIDEMLDDVRVLRRDTKAKPFRVERAVAHEVADELRELRRHLALRASAEV